MLQVKHAGHSTLTTPDIGRMVDYFTRIVGLSLVARDKDRAILATNNKSIKSGQQVVLHTDPAISGGGCLTYIDPSGDRGGFVSWNVNCSRSTPWVIK